MILYMLLTHLRARGRQDAGPQGRPGRPAPRDAGPPHPRGPPPPIRPSGRTVPGGVAEGGRRPSPLSQNGRDSVT